MEDTRHTLIEKLKDQHDGDAWDVFSSTYRSYIYAVLRKLNINHEDAADLQQDILLKIWKNLPDFDYQPNKAKFRTWLYSVIKNLAYNHLSSRNSELKRIDRYFSLNNDCVVGSAELNNLMQTEWQCYITHMAMLQLRKTFNPQSIEIFEKSLRGDKVEQLANEYDLKENTVYRIKNRVKERMILEVAEIRKNLE